MNRMNAALMLGLVFALIGPVCFLWPPRGRAEAAIVDAIHRNCARATPCEITFDNIDWIEWDELTVFRPGLDNTEINRILGFDLIKSHKYPLSRALVFTKGKNVVYWEEDFVEIEGYRNDDLSFSGIDPVEGFKRYPRASVLEIIPKRISSGQYFSIACRC